MPGANELSTVEWQRAHWMPMDSRLPSPLKWPVTPTTELSLSSASVVAGSLRSTRPCRSLSWSSEGSADPRRRGGGVVEPGAPGPDLVLERGAQRAELHLAADGNRRRGAHAGSAPAV